MLRGGKITVGDRIAVARRRDSNRESRLVIGATVADDAQTKITAGEGAKSRTRKRLGGTEDIIQTLSRAVEQSPACVVITDPLGTIEYVNPKFCQLTGYAPEEVIGQNPRVLKSGETATEEYEALWSAITSGRTWTGTFLNKKKSGELYWEQASISPIRNGRRTTHYVAVKEDITERKRAEEALRASERDFRLLAENSTDMIARHSPEGVPLYVSPACRHLLGYEPEELVGRPLSDLIHPEDRVAFERHWLAMIDGTQIETAICRFRRNDATYVWLEATSRAIRHVESGEVVEVQTASRDITERKSAEEALRELALERAEQVITAHALSEASVALATDPENARLHEIILEHMGRVVPCTTAHIFEYRDGWAVTAGGYGEPRLPEGLHVARLDDARHLFPRSDEQGRFIRDTTVAPGWHHLPPWHGQHEIRSAIIIPLVVHGEVYGCLSVGSTMPNVYDVRHYRVAFAFGERIVQALWNARLYQLEQERARAAEQLAALRSDFVAAVSHELRTPLTAVLGYAELLKGRWEMLSDQQRRSFIDLIAAAANRQKLLVEDLLRVSRLDTAEPTIRHEPIRVVDAIRGATAVVNGAYSDQRITSEGPPQLAVLADASLMERILINLIDNAAKYSAEGSPVGVTWMGEGDMCVVRVHDRGPGIPEEARGILFSRFGRVPGSRMRAGRVGTGLGLYLGREYAQAMGGSLELESTNHTGSVFCLRLPIIRR
jgi:PAS domain S-box-containing protein